MVDLILSEYWSKSDAFLLPLTGLPKETEYEMKSYLFWEENSIEDYKLMLVFSYENYEEFKEYCNKEIFPILDKGTLLVENYDYLDRAIFILDMSEWAFDIDMFLYGKYSKMSKDAKTVIDKYHRAFNGKIKCYLHSVLHPYEEQSILNNMSAINYIIEHYGFDADEINKIGEVGGIFDREHETLLTHSSQLC